jgi:cyclopropane-fatty-acyl-phospholipid synthase
MAVFPHAEATLEAASRHKLELLCQKLDLRPGHHLLEIGTGWGGLAIHAARHHGCRVTTATISPAQHAHAQAQVRQAGLEDRVTVLLRDYRDLQGQYDRLVSVEMIEAIGHRQYGVFFATCARLLKPDGRMVLQAITIDDRLYEQARRTVDFIQRYIFPGGCLPSLGVLCATAGAHSDLAVQQVQEYGLHYATTLRHWRTRLHDQWARLRHMGYGETFLRMWDFYFAYCEGGFLTRTTGTVQMVLTRPEAAPCAPGGMHG